MNSTITINGKVKEFSELSEVWGKIVQPIQSLDSIDANTLATANAAMQSLLIAQGFEASDWHDEFSDSQWVYESADGNSVEVRVVANFNEDRMELIIDSMSGDVAIEPINASRKF